VHDRDGFRGHPELIGAHLGQRGGDSLPDRGHARVNDDVAGRVDLHARVLPRAEAGLLQHAAHADADVAALPPRLGLGGTRLVIAGDLQRLIERRPVVAAVVDVLLGQRGAADLVGHLGRRDEVAPSQLDGVDAEPGRGHVEQALAHERPLVAPGPPIGSGRGLVGEHAVGHARVVGNPVRPGHQGRGQLGHDHPVGADVGAEIGQEVVDEGHDAPLPIEADLDVVILLARVVGGHQVLAAVLDPLDGTVQAHGRPRHDQVLRVELAAHAEAAADLQLHELDQVLGMSEQIGQHAPVEVRDLGHAPQAEHPAPRVVRRGQAPGLHGYAGVALDREALAHPMRGRREHARGVSPMGLQPVHHVAPEHLVQDRGAGLERAARIGHGGERVVVDVDQLQRVLGEIPALGDHHRDRLAHVPHHVGGQHGLQEAAQVDVMDRQPHRYR
jgi:hypothetical protein